MFQCSSASRKFLNHRGVTVSTTGLEVSVLFSEPKIPQSRAYPASASGTHIVSVLFSEPKIPQFQTETPSVGMRTRFQCSSASRKFLNLRAGEIRIISILCFSALQRAENSSIPHVPRAALAGFCFSALQRAENSSISLTFARFSTESSSFSALQRAENSSINTPFRALSELFRSFSALQRAENSSINSRAPSGAGRSRFQCSSASRKFLNFCTAASPPSVACVSVLFSEPKIPQSRADRADRGDARRVSVLFSEPKIPQFARIAPPTCPARRVSVLFSEPKIPQSLEQRTIVLPELEVSVLFSEPKIPQ